MREYGCLMLDFKKPSFIKDIQSKIDKNDVYFGKTAAEKEEYGIVDDAHITICYGFNDEVVFEDVVKYVSPLENYKTKITGVSFFENDEYDVMKCDVVCPEAKKTNKKIVNNFTIHTDYPDFHPHITIAYLKKGASKKYRNNISQVDEIFPTNFAFSKAKERRTFKDSEVKKMKNEALNEVFIKFLSDIGKGNHTSFL